MPMPELNSFINDRYRLVSVLGQGGMGIAYRAWDVVAQVPVVIKMPLATDGDKQDAFERFRREANGMATLRHPHIVPVLDEGVDNSGIPYIVIRFLPGGALSDRLRRNEEGFPLPNQPASLHDWLPRIASALDFMHSMGVVHRDVKPGNIFFDARNQAFLGDFGIAKVFDPSAGVEKALTLTATNVAVGSQAYMAPELFQPKPVLAGALDQYALAITVYEALAGTRPFKGESAHIVVEHLTLPPQPLRKVLPQLPEPVSEAVHRALAKNSHDRFPTCADFAESVLRHVPSRSGTAGVAWVMCPSCRRILKLTEAIAGKVGKCNRCSSALRVAKDLESVWLIGEDNVAADGEAANAQTLSSVTSKHRPASSATPNQARVRSAGRALWNWKYVLTAAVCALAAGAWLLRLTLPDIMPAAVENRDILAVDQPKPTADADAPLPAVTAPQTFAPDAPTSGEAPFDRNDNDSVSRKASSSLQPSAVQQSAAPEAGFGVKYEIVPEVNTDYLGVDGGGLIVQAVIPNSTADHGGIMRGDVLMMFDGIRLSRAKDLPDFAALPIGSSHTLALLRNGDQKTIELVLKQAVDAPKGFHPPAIGELTTITFTESPGLITGLQVAGKRVCSTTGQGEVGVWDYAGSAAKRTVLTSGQSADLTASGAAAVVGGRYGALATWNTSSGQNKAVLAENDEVELSGPVRINGDGSRIASITRGILHIRDAKTGTLIYAAKIIDELMKTGRDGAKLFSLNYELSNFSPSGKYLMIVATTGLAVWNVETRAFEWSWYGDASIVAFAPSPDWSLCAVGYESGTIRVLDVEENTDRIKLRGHTRGVTGLAWHGNNLLASASDSDRSVRLWNVHPGKQLWQINLESKGSSGRSWGPQVVCFDPDEPRVWTGVFDIKCYAIPPLEKEAWGISAPQSEAVDFGSRIKKSEAVADTASDEALLVGAVTALDRLGSVCDYRYGDWSGIWIRRPETNKFDCTMVHSSAKCTLTYTATLIFAGNRVQWLLADSVHSDTGKGPDKTFTGVLSTDGKTIRFKDGAAEHVITASAPQARPPDVNYLTNSIGMSLAVIPPGEFLMGTHPAEALRLDPADNDLRVAVEGNKFEEKQHLVRITRPFLLGVHEVTQKDYRTVMGQNPSHFIGDDLPVEHLTWKQARDFCKKLTELPNEQAAGRRYRLPTEAEWEYACRAGTTTRFNVGDNLTHANARFHKEDDSEPQQTTAVGSYPANAWGLHDMHGNVWEWTGDWFNATYFYAAINAADEDAGLDDPQGPDDGTHHVLRGGSASVQARECYSALRGEAPQDGPGRDPTSRFQFIGDFGFRVACDIDEALPDNHKTRGPLYLCALEPRSVDSWEGHFATNGKLPEVVIRDSRYGNVINVGGVVRPHSLYLSPPPTGKSRICYDIPVGYKFLVAAVAINDSVFPIHPPESPLVFKVIDQREKVLWASPPFRGPMGRIIDCRVDLTGVRQLCLTVEAEAGNGWAHAVWVDPRLVRDDKSTTETPQETTAAVTDLLTLEMLGLDFRKEVHGRFAHLEVKEGRYVNIAHKIPAGQYLFGFQGRVPNRGTTDMILNAALGKAVRDGETFALKFYRSGFDRIIKFDAATTAKTIADGSWKQGPASR
jgi:formylglycine-generating enzyme required for sulfatase activity/tRNA A-37 threonylcarbamoyl transferase component Bud32